MTAPELPNAPEADAVGAPVEQPVRPARWWKCDTHGPAVAGAWGCPECVSEMRTELMFLRRVLHDLMQTGVAQQTLRALRGGQGCNTKDGEAWLAAASFAKAPDERY